MESKPATNYYAGDTAMINCQIKQAIKWNSLIIKEDKKWAPVVLKLSNDLTVTWSRSREGRHGADFEVVPLSSIGSDISLNLTIKDLECKDSQTFLCILDSEVESREIVQKSRLVIVGKPDDQIQLTLGPSIIENRPLRLTATWNAGYPYPWTNLTWQAIGSNNRTYNLESFGQYREDELKTDHQHCATRMTRSFVIMPTLDLNDTVVTVGPNLGAGVRSFVDGEMAKVLREVKPGSERILVIPRNYCDRYTTRPTDTLLVPHPYTVCNKYIRCLRDDLVVRLCPWGTCFTQGMRECA